MEVQGVKYSDFFLHCVGMFHAITFIVFDHARSYVLSDSLPTFAGTIIIIVVSAVSAVIVLLVGGAIGVYIWKQRKIQKKRRGKKILENKFLFENDKSIKHTVRVQHFPLLKKDTNPTRNMVVFVLFYGLGYWNGILIPHLLGFSPLITCGVSK